MSFGPPSLCAVAIIIADGLSRVPWFLNWFSLPVVVRCSTYGYVVPNTQICHTSNFTGELNVVVIDTLAVGNAGLLMFIDQGTDNCDDRIQKSGFQNRFKFTTPLRVIG